jgi:glycosyltransferase involved in cell wall biosynthesis
LRSMKFRVVSLIQPNKITQKLARNAWLFTLRQQFLSRHVRHLGAGFDLVISTFNEMDLGSPGIQYIHAPQFSAYNSEARRILRFPDSMLRRGWKYTCGLLFGSSERRLRQNLSVTNSQWTASLLQNTCHIPAKVLYPPVRASQSLTQWTDRRNSFLCVARFVRDKQLELAIHIVDRVRSMGFDVGLHIVGHVTDRRYFAVLSAMQNSRSSWLSFDQDVTRSALTDLLNQYKYGIHPRQAEQFGIGVAEMAGAGCIPFVPSVGGQAEIVGRDSRLLFDDVDDAAEKIARVLSSSEAQDCVRWKILAVAEKFSAARFMDSFRQLIDEVLKDRVADTHASSRLERIVK